MTTASPVTLAAVVGDDTVLPEQDIGLNAGGVRWHCRRSGQGPPLLLLHGTGASVHSWQGLAPILARHYDVVAFDLPGHGQSSAGAPEAATLPGMSRAIGAALDKLRVAPRAIVGHSAGAAIAVRLTLDGAASPDVLISLNGAFMPFGGAAAPLVLPLARVFANSHTVAGVMASRASDTRAVERLLSSTGSRLSAKGLAAYQRLLTSPDHIRATLRMMAHWDLRPLFESLPGLNVPLKLIVGANDGTVPPWQAERVAAICPRARVLSLPDVGHLAHEEAPQLVADVILSELEPYRRRQC